MTTEQREFGERLNAACDAADWPERGRAARLARLTGKTPTGARKWVRGLAIPEQAELRIIADDLGVLPHDLRYGQSDGAIPVRHFEPGDSSVDGYVSVRVAAGAGRENGDSEVMPIPFLQSFLDKLGVRADDCCVLFADGDSMEPTIHDGDAMLVHRRVEKLIDGEIYVFTVDGMERVKRASWNVDKSLTLISDNPSPRHPNEIVARADLAALKVFGRVRWAGGERGRL